MRMQWAIVLEIFKTTGISSKVIGHCREDLSGIGLTRECYLKRMEKKCGVMAEIGDHPALQAITILIATVLSHQIAYGILMVMKCGKFINTFVSNLTAQQKN